MVGPPWVKVEGGPANLEEYRITSLFARDPCAVVVQAVEIATGAVVAIRIGGHLEPPTIVGLMQPGDAGTTGRVLPRGFRRARLTLVDDARLGEFEGPGIVRRRAAVIAAGLAIGMAAVLGVMTRIPLAWTPRGSEAPASHQQSAR
jgi:hypothetical protein